MQPLELATARYRSLVRQLAEERGHRRGWKKDVAELLGVHATYLSRLDSEPELVLGADAIRRAIDRLRLREPFFFNPELGTDPAWREHVETASPPTSRRRVSGSPSPDLRHFDGAVEAAGEVIAASVENRDDFVDATERMVAELVSMSVVSLLDALEPALERLSDAETDARELEATQARAQIELHAIKLANALLALSRELGRPPRR